MPDARRGSTTSQESSPTILYIAGYGRSGSTVLDVALGNVPGVFGAGELANLFTAAERREFCSCGVPVPDCPVWRPVVDEFAAPGMGQNAVDWRAVACRISAVTGASVVVDSSKTTRKTARRPQQLREAGLNVVGVHLVRHPASVLDSVRHGRNRGLADGRTPPGGISVVNTLRATVSWWLSNRAAERAVRGAFLRSTLVHFEDFLDRPTDVVRSIAALVDLEPEQALPEELDAGHGIAGNRVRQSGPLRLRQADLERATKPLSRILTSAAKRYGYA